MKPVITVSGQHGTGKTTYSKTLSMELGLKHVSAGILFREMARKRGLDLPSFSRLALKDPSIDKLVDDILSKEAEAGNVVLDGQLAAWMAGEKAGLKIYLFAPDPIRFKRIAERDRIPVEEAEKITLTREREERERFRILYNIDTHDISIYDVIFDTSLLSLEEAKKMVVDMVRDYLHPRKVR